jgi:uncharacterized damage-inducible protein DinB
MSKLELVRDFFAYNEWANNLLLEKSGDLDMGQLAGPQGASFESILGNMAHVLAAQVNWLERWQHGQNKRHTVDLGDSIKTLADLRKAFAASHADLRDYISGLNDVALDEVLTMKDRSDTEFQQPLWHMMLHVCNHGTFHRGEVAMALTAWSHSPGDMDYLDYVDTRS